MYDCKNPTWQGYGPPTQMHQCLPHTGSDLMPFAIFALLLIVAGVALFYMGKRLPSR